MSDPVRVQMSDADVLEPFLRAEVEAATVNRCIEAIESDPMRNNGASSYGMGLASHALRSLLPATPAEQPTTGHNELARAVPQLEEDRETGNRATYAPSPKVAAGEGSSPFRPGNPVEQPDATANCGHTEHMHYGRYVPEDPTHSTPGWEPCPTGGAE